MLGIIIFIIISSFFFFFFDLLLSLKIFVGCTLLIVIVFIPKVRCKERSNEMRFYYPFFLITNKSNCINN